MTTHYFAALAWIGGRWERDAVLTVGPDGHFQAIAAGQPAPGDATRLAGPVIPALVDAHSHAFQRAFAGLAERRTAPRDDFWSWRDRMYRVALRVTPRQLLAIAAQLYVELLQGGYTQVCEFHYLHHQPDGRPYPDRLEMAWALASAAERAGLGLTVLPALYARAGFDLAGLRPEQQRFATDASWTWQASLDIAAAGRRHVTAGLAIHSLRAASAADIAALCRLADDSPLPRHIHVAEQTREVDECQAASGLTPIDWLYRHARCDSRWQLIHATHAHPREIDAVAASGAGVVLCPGTEANLGDGHCDLPAWLAQAVPISLGSDSQVTRSWVEELRWLEYGQRLSRQVRNVAADPPRESSAAARLFRTCVSAGAAAAGFAHWGLEAGARADFLVLDPRAPGLLGVPEDALLDGLVFASQGPSIRDVHVAGQRVITAGRHPAQDAIADDFAQCMQTLWADA